MAIRLNGREVSTKEAAAIQAAAQAQQPILQYIRENPEETRLSPHPAPVATKSALRRPQVAQSVRV